MKLRTMTDADFDALPYGSEGLWRKFMHACRRCATLEEIIAATKSKRYTRTRIDRMVMCAFLGITKDMLVERAPYVRCLALNDRGRCVLKQMKQHTVCINAGESFDHPYWELEKRAGEAEKSLEKAAESNRQNRPQETQKHLNDAARDAVKSYLRLRLDPKYIRTSERAFFLSNRQQRISAKTVQWVVYKYLDKAGLSSRGLSVHKLRHTAATLMYQSGNVDIRVLKDILGHEQLNTTQIYTHLGNSNLQDAMKANPLAKVNIDDGD